MDSDWRKARNVLAVRLDNLGDVLLMTPAIHAIRESLPDGRITLLASPVGAQVGHLDPDVDDVIVYRAPWVDPWRQLPHDSAREQAMIATLRERAFDGAIIFTSFRQSALPAAYLCYLAGIPLRLAASIDGPGSLLTTRHKHPERMMHEVERGLDLVAAIGMTTGEADLVLAVPDEGRAQATVALAAHGIDLARGKDPVRPLVVIHPGCTMPARTYPPEMFAATVELLARRLDATVVLTGVADERDLVQSIYDQLTPAVRRHTLPLTGALPFPAFCALVAGAALVVTNNTGPMHVAAATKTPVAALFALTNPPEQWGPWRVPHRLLYHDVACRICYSRVCPYSHECLRLVPPERVVAAVLELLEETNSPRRHGDTEEHGEIEKTPSFTNTGHSSFKAVKAVQSTSLETVEAARNASFNLRVVSVSPCLRGSNSKDKEVR